jgi:hypothetical protein
MSFVQDMKECMLSLRLYSKKDFFDYSLGGYLHRERWARTRRCSIMNKWRRTSFRKNNYYHREEDFYWSWLSKPEYFVGWNSQTRLRRIILELRHRDKTWRPWLKYITTVRPQDPSRVARYTHIDALCWYVSVSTTRRKILVDALGTLRTTGIHSL